MLCISVKAAGENSQPLSLIDSPNTPSNVQWKLEYKKVTKLIHTLEKCAKWLHLLKVGIRRM